MIIYGTLNVEGKSDSMVSFLSSKLPPGENDWNGLYFASSSAFIDWAIVRNAAYATVLSQPDTAAITNSLYESNGTFDIQIGGAGADLPVLIEGNTLNVGGGSGIVVHDDGGTFGGYFVDNTLNGTSSSSNGIYIGDAIGAASPYLEGNVISGFSAGAGIRSDKVGSDPVLIRNVLSNNKWGLYFSNGNPTVGSAADTTSDNVCTGNTTAGIFFTGSSTTGAVRQNRCTGNGTGISTKGNANPNLGSSGAHGYNILVPNTTYCLWNQSTSGTVSAQGNYLGGCSPPPGICWNGSFDLSNALCSVPSDVSVLVEPVPRFQLLAPLPNPTRGGTVIRFNVGEEKTRVAAAIFDVSGRLVKNLGEGNYEVGEHRLTWNGTRDSGYPASSGLYFIRVSVNDVPSDVSRVLVTR